MYIWKHTNSITPLWGQNVNLRDIRTNVGTASPNRISVWFISIKAIQNISFKKLLIINAEDDDSWPQKYYCWQVNLPEQFVFVTVECSILPVSYVAIFSRSIIMILCVYPHMYRPYTQQNPVGKRLLVVWHVFRATVNTAGNNTQWKTWYG